MRVYFKGREGPGLAMSRSIGDTDAHSIGVIEKPGNNFLPLIIIDIQVLKLDRKRMRYTLVLASDGLWTVFGPNIVLKHLSGLLGKGVMRIAKDTQVSGSESDSPDQYDKKRFRGKAPIAV